VLFFRFILIELLGIRHRYQTENYLFKQQQQQQDNNNSNRGCSLPKMMPVCAYVALLWARAW